MKKLSLRMFVLLVSVVFFTGCGKELKLAIKAAEAEKDQPSAALVRNIQVTYHTPAGTEEMRESVPVLGLSQPVSVRSDLLKDVRVEKDGLFEARGYTADGTLVLRGRALADPDATELVELTLSREDSHASLLGSPLLRRVRLADAAVPREFVREAKELRVEMENGRCVALPDLKMNPGSGAHPRVVFEGSIKAPSFRIEIGILLEKGIFKAMSGLLPLVVNSAGDAELELGRRFLEGYLFKNPAKLILRLHSNQYEGCLEISTRPELAPVTAAFRLEGGVGLEVYPRQLTSLGTLSLFNPNDVAIRVQVDAVVVNAGNSETVQPCTHRSNNPIALEQLGCKPSIAENIEVQPHAYAGLSIFAALDKSGKPLNRNLRVHWSLTNQAPFEAGGGLATVLAPSLIP